MSVQSNVFNGNPLYVTEFQIRIHKGTEVCLKYTLSPTYRQETLLEMATAPAILNIHTPTSSFAIVHSCR
jgi:hypothetical protein